MDACYRLLCYVEGSYTESLFPKLPVGQIYYLNERIGGRNGLVMIEFLRVGGFLSSGWRIVCVVLGKVVSKQG